MIAIQFDIIDRHRERPFQPAVISDFHLREAGQVSAEEILENPCITLYSFDFENRRAVFVETPADIDFSQMPFYFVAQYENARRVITVSFETLLHLTQSITLDDTRLIFIHSVGRSGSTLASQIFAQIPGIINISEPDVLTLLVRARHAKIMNDDELIALLRACICILCKREASTAWVIKGRSYVIELADWLHKLFPQTRNLFLYRNAETWLQSNLRAFGQHIESAKTESENIEQMRLERMMKLLPVLASYSANEPLSQASTMVMVWLALMTRFEHCHSTGIEMLAIRYADWQSNPHKTARAMLDYAGIHPVDMADIDETLSKDSQAGTGLSQDTLRQRGKTISDDDLTVLQHHLQKHESIHDADFEASNTLHI